MAEKETQVQKIVRISKIRENIRNICTSAHIHHGKCVAEGTKIMFADGGIKTARELFEETIRNGSVAEENEDYVVYTPKKIINIFSLNKQTGRIESKPISHIWRLAGGKTIKIKLRNGFKIETTQEHKYIVWRNSDFTEVEAIDLKIGDRIVCARKLETSSNLKIKKEILKRLSEENFYVNLKNDFSELMKKWILEYGVSKIKSDAEICIKEKSFYHGIWQNRYNLGELIKILKIFKFSLEEAYDNIESIFYRTGKQRGQNSLKIKLPQNFEEFFYLAGLFLGDGSGKKFIVGKEELGNEFIRICKTMGMNAAKTESRERTPEIHTNMTLAYMLNRLFDYPLKKKAHNIKISDFVFSADNKHVSKLLKGYFDCDGCVENSRRAVTISSASSKMVDDLHLLLLRFGCISIKEKDNAISISGLSALNFEKEIGFGLKEKAEKLRILAKNVSGSIVCDTVKVGNQIMLINRLVKSMAEGELAYIEVVSIEQDFKEVVYDFTVPENHNFVAEGMVIHNTAFTDNLLAASGHMAAKSAGDLEAGMATWQHADEQERLMTVDAANVSMVHKFEGQEYLINLIDTPGHIDFSGNVTRAMRAIDGTIVLICAVEGVMPQTETVLRQALRERVKPVLFINKVDRLIKELKLSPEKMQERLIGIFKEFNVLIEKIAEPEYQQKWKVDINEGSVAFGSARENWALSVPYMKKKGVTFKDIIRLYEMSEEDRKKWIWDNAPLYEVILDMVVKHMPNPLTAQKYRIPKVWRGDMDSEFGNDLITCNPNGKPAFVITRIVIEPRSGKEVSAGRLFSGTLRPGMEVWLNLAKKRQRIQQVLIYNGIRAEQVEEIPSGNVLAIAGVTGEAGETITLEPETTFEELKHIFEPVITKAIEPAKPMDLPKLIEVLRKVGKEDPSIKIEINEETGENLISGMGELHLEIIENRIKTEKNMDIKTSPPIVVYRESVRKKSQEMEGKSPNKHNKFYFVVEPLEDPVYETVVSGKVPEGRIKKKDIAIRDAFVAAGMDSKIAEKVKDIHRGNIFIDETRGQVYLGEVIEMIFDMFEDVMENGPLAREPCVKVKVRLMDMKLHEDAIHRGPSQVYPAIREGIRGAMMTGAPVMYEPLQTILLEAPVAYTGELTKLVTSKRGQLIEMNQEREMTLIKAKMPVAEMIGWSSDLRSATEGRAVSSLIDQAFERLPDELQEKVRRGIVSRKGLTEGQLGA